MAEPTEEYRLITEKEYQQLLEDSTFLQNLRAAGVGNWDGYHYGYSGEPDW